VTWDPETEEAMEGRLAVREGEGAFLVVRAGDPEDWLARFDKDGEFPAREWAENMANLYNRHLARRSTGPPTPPGTRPGGYHPHQ
jgi:hypothetical protein